MDLGFVIGQDSLGGACAIQFTTLPDGTILVSSSHYALLNQAGDLIEDGIEVDLEKALPIDWTSFSLELGSLYDMLFDCSFAFSRDENHIFLQFDELATSDVLTDVSYRAVVRKEGSSWVLTQRNSDGDFAFDYWIESHDEAYVIAIEVTYQFKGETFTETLGSEVFDDHATTFDFPLTHLDVGATVSGGKYAHSDYDSFEVTITEAARYRITLNSAEFPDVWLYDGLGNYLERGHDFDLTPGTYYLRIDYPNLYIYTIGLVMLEDDTLTGVEIEIPIGPGTFDLYVDYAMDLEWFEFTLAERTLLTFSLDLSSNSSYDIKSSGATTYYRSFLNLSGDASIELILEPGHYVLPVYTILVGTVTLHTTRTMDFTDYTDVFNLNPDNYGILTLGENTITFEAESDIDIYQLTITEEMDVVFVFDRTAGSIYRRADHLYAYLAPTDILHLYPGTYYFDFVESKYPDRDTLWCELVVVDNTDDDIVRTLEFGEMQYATSVSKADVDYFAFTAPETTEYRFTWLGDRLNYRIYDVGHGLVYQSDRTRTYTLPAGEYTIEIGLFGASFSDLVFVGLMIDYQISTDLYRNATGLPVEFYSIMTFGVANAIRSSLEYEGDYDVLIFYVTVTTLADFEPSSDV
ncbi:MAG: hypothetical protein Q8N15_01985, partial [Bacillota bacterium]|nr:hypothetical protein [Bacillota bacterium]